MTVERLAGYYLLECRVGRELGFVVQPPSKCIRAARGPLIWSYYVASVLLVDVLQCGAMELALVAQVRLSV